MTGPRHGYGRLAATLMASLLTALSTCATTPPRKCFIEFAVHGPLGDQLSGFRVTSAESIIRETDEERLGLQYDPIRRIAVGNRLYADEVDYHDTLAVTLERVPDESVVKLVNGHECEQYESVFFGERASGSHEYASWFERRGRLVGCALDDDWWIRSSPLLRAAVEPGPPVGDTHDAYLEPSSGDFTIRARHGVRHIFVVGRGKDPVRVFTVNLDAGSDAPVDLGEYDLSDSCPVDSR